MTSIISFIIVFSIIVISHELGHFFFARRAGIKVLELGIGFGPRLLKFVKNKILYTINLIPLGGFIKIAGINPDAEEKTDRYLPKESYAGKRPGQKFLTILGGPFANILAAFLILFLIFSIFGIPSGISNEISKVSKNSEAERLGLRSGDMIISVNNHKVTEMAKEVKLIHGSPGNIVYLNIKRDGQTLAFQAIPRLDEKLKVGLIGFSLKPTYKKISFIPSILEAARQTVGIMALILYMFGMLFTGQVPFLDIAGPVGIAQFTGQAASEGIIALLTFTAFLSINLGVINLLPIPALDGGRIIFILIEAVRRKPVDIKLENKIHYVGIMLLLGLFILITANDIARIFIK